MQYKFQWAVENHIYLIWQHGSAIGHEIEAASLSSAQWAPPITWLGTANNEQALKPKLAETETSTETETSNIYVFRVFL